MQPCASSIADAVSMPKLLTYLGIPVNERTHRSRCLLHGGTNPTAFSWTEAGLWHCFHCGRSGNKFGLVKAALKCDFREALKVMAVLAGVDLANVANISAAERRRVNARQQKERRLDLAAERYQALERGILCHYAARLRMLYQVEGLVAFCLKESVRFGFDSTEFWWDALARVYGECWETLAIWTLLAFAKEDTRQRFVLFHQRRLQMVVEVLDAGGVADDRGHFRELAI
jgi:CHC2 zinc finger